jgi:hypothetical protein
VVWADQVGKELAFNYFLWKWTVTDMKKFL